MISGANENELEIANARADVLLSINDDRQHLLGLIKYWEEECFRYKKENEAYENMRKELIKEFNFYETTEWGIKGYEILEKFRNILNKVGEDNDKS